MSPNNSFENLPEDTQALFGQQWLGVIGTESLNKFAASDLNITAFADASSDFIRLSKNDQMLIFKTILAKIDVNQRMTKINSFRLKLFEKAVSTFKIKNHLIRKRNKTDGVLEEIITLSSCLITNKMDADFLDLLVKSDKSG